jgi:hypothetical protein
MIVPPALQTRDQPFEGWQPRASWIDRSAAVEPIHEPYQQPPGMNVATLVVRHWAQTQSKLSRQNQADPCENWPLLVLLSDKIIQGLLGEATITALASRQQLRSDHARDCESS